MDELDMIVHVLDCMPDEEPYEDEEIIIPDEQEE